MVGGIEAVFHRIESILTRVTSSPSSASPGFGTALQAAIAEDANPRPAAELSGEAPSLAADASTEAGEEPAVRTITPPPGVYLTIGGYVGTAPLTSVGAVAPSGAVFPVVGVNTANVTNSFGWPWTKGLCFQCTMAMAPGNAAAAASP